VDAKILETILAMMSRYDKPIYPVSLAAFPDDELIYSAPGYRYRVIVYKTPEMAALCLSKQYRYSRFLQTRGGG
jgi:hypothetical protein